MRSTCAAPSTSPTAPSSATATPSSALAPPFSVVHHPIHRTVHVDRNTEANHGNVFVECTFSAINRPLPWSAALPLTPPSRVCLPVCPIITASTTPTRRPCSLIAASTAFRPPAGDPSTARLRIFISLSSTAPTRGPPDRHLTAASSLKATDRAARRADHRQLQRSGLRTRRLDAGSRPVTFALPPQQHEPRGHNQRDCSQRIFAPFGTSIALHEIKPVDRLGIVSILRRIRIPGSRETRQFT